VPQRKDDALGFAVGAPLPQVARMDKAHSVFEAGREAQQKFDYFVTGLTGAVLSYVSQNFSPHRIGMNPESLNPLALVLLGVSFFCGFKRIETSTLVMQLNFQMLDAEERSTAAVGHLSGGRAGYDPATGRAITMEETEARRQYWVAARDDANKAVRVAAARADRYYHWRNRLLYAGLAAIVLSKVLQPYYGASISHG
jgi:hypothetical protein